MSRRSYFEEGQAKFSLTRAGAVPVRNAQLGALHAIGAHFSLRDDPAIVALPTGVGKTVVAAAAPFVVPGVQRVLYVVPTKVLRYDTVANLRGQLQLRKVSLLGEDIADPSVLDVSTKPSDWSEFADCDAAVALPNALFELIESHPPDRDLFDLVVFDEAHHVPAKTWQLIAEAFDARHVLLTATPYRRDSRQLPGDVVYNYPLSRAISDGAYAPIDVIGVEAFGKTEEDRDRAVAERAVEALRGPGHAGTSSRLLVRAATKARVEGLAEIYRELGVSVHVVHSGLTPRTVEERIAEVRSGRVDGIAFVGVLGEGFDCPELKVGAYHDKHKSLPITLQFLGRLSRVCADAGPPQVVSSLETLRDDTWGLWRRDSDWSALVPRLAETATDDVTRRTEVLAEMPEFPRAEVSLADVVVRPSFGLYEVIAEHVASGESVGESVEFGLDRDGVERTGLTTGSPFAGGSIIWSYLSEREQFLMFVTSHIERPDWLRSRALDTERFEMHAVLVRKDPGGLPVVAVTSTTRKREAEIMALLTGAPDGYRLASPDFMRRFLSVAEVGNIQHLGTRNAAPGSQARTYTTNTGRAVEDGIAYEDLRDDVIGHVGAQCHIDGKDYNGGVSITNSRLWLIKRFPVEGYIDFVSGVLQQMGAEQPGGIRRLTARFEEVLRTWPDSEPIAAVLDPYFFTDVSTVGGRHPVDVDLRVSEPNEKGMLPLHIPYLEWSATLRTNGTFDTPGRVIDVETATGVVSLEDLLLQFPPTVYYRDGSSSRGQRFVPAGGGQASPPIADIVTNSWDWSTTNIEHEIPRDGASDSIHEKVVSELLSLSHSAWVVGDDGSGEIADHLLIEPFDDDQVHVHLYHSKASSESAPGLRTRDLDELVAQIVRSKRWVALADRDFWERLSHRTLNRQSTQVIASPDGEDPSDFSDACLRWADRRPLVTIHYVGVQPGLDATRLLSDHEADSIRNPRMLETIGACAAWVGGPNSTLSLIGS